MNNALIAITNEFLNSSERDSESDAEIDDELLLDVNYSIRIILFAFNIQYKMASAGNCTGNLQMGTQSQYYYISVVDSYYLPST